MLNSLLWYKRISKRKRSVAIRIVLAISNSIPTIVKNIVIRCSVVCLLKHEAYIMLNGLMEEGGRQVKSGRINE